MVHNAQQHIVSFFNASNDVLNYHIARPVHISYTLQYLHYEFSAQSNRYFLFIYGAGVETSPLLLRPFIGLLYELRMIDGDDCEAIIGVNE
jgi:hypothetical protein